MTSGGAGSPRSIAWLALELVAVAVGYLIGGVPGVVVVGAALIATPRSAGPRPAATAAAGFLAVAALATVLQAPRHQISLGYARDRPIAAGAAQLAGLAVLVAIARSDPAAGSPFPIVSPRRRVARVAARPQEVLRSAGRALPYLAAVALAAAVWEGTAAATALSPDELALVDNLRAGLGYTVGSGAARSPAAVAPLAPVVAAFAPGPLGVTTLAVWCLAVVAVMRLAGRFAGLPAAGAAGLLAALLPAITAQGLAGALATLLSGVGLLLAWPSDVTPGRAAAAGVALAGAGLARPEAVVVIGLVAVWLGLALGRRAVAPLPALLLAATVAWAPWQLWLQEKFGAWLPRADPDPEGWAGWAAPIVVALAVGVSATGLAHLRRRSTA